MYGVTDLLCVIGAAARPRRRSTDNVGLAAATNTLEFTYAIDCTRRRALTYTQKFPAVALLAVGRTSPLSD